MLTAPLIPSFFRRIVATALLCGVVACSPDKPGQQTATGAASPRAENANADDTAARDKELSAQLVGPWMETASVDGQEIEVVAQYAADHSLAVSARAKGNADVVATGKGTWSISRGVLNYIVAFDKTRHSGADEILRINATELVYVDSDDKKTKIASRFAGVLAAKPASASAPDVSLPNTSAASPPALAQPGPRETQLADESLFVADKDVTAFAFTVNETVQVRLIIEIDEKVPLNVVVLPGRVSGPTYVMHLAALMLGQVVDAVGAGTGDKSPTEADLFASRLSKRAAYGRFESPWVTLAPGPRTIVLDNSGELTPSRGDAPLHLRLFTRAVP